MQWKRIFIFSCIFFTQNPCFFIEFCEIAPKMVQWPPSRTRPPLISTAKVNAAKKLSSYWPGARAFEIRLLLAIVGEQVDSRGPSAVEWSRGARSGEASCAWL